MNSYKIIACAIWTLILSNPAKSQEMKFEGTQPAKKEVLDLLKKEADIMDNVTDVKKRDSLRRQILSKAFFYQGLDGKPINLDGLTKRQTKNQFKMLETKLISQTLYQYESTAILVVIDWQKVADKGEIHESYNSFLMVMGIEEGEWKILSDIIGRKPNM